MQINWNHCRTCYRILVFLFTFYYFELFSLCNGDKLLPSLFVNLCVCFLWSWFTVFPFLSLSVLIKLLLAPSTLCLCLGGNEEVGHVRGKWSEVSDSGWRGWWMEDKGGKERGVGTERMSIHWFTYRPANTHTHTHHISFIYVSSSHGNLFCVEMLCVCVCVCLTLSHSIRPEETLMTCICGNTSDSNINTHQLEISPEP